MCQRRATTKDALSQTPDGQLARVKEVHGLQRMASGPAVQQLCKPADAQLFAEAYRHRLAYFIWDAPCMKGQLPYVLVSEMELHNQRIDQYSVLTLLLDSFRRQKKEVLSFTSVCSGLPAPEHTSVPLRPNQFAIQATRPTMLKYHAFTEI